MMELIKRYPYANIYSTGKGKRKGILGGIPNVPIDAAGKLEPMDNKIKTILNPDMDYEIERGPAIVRFQDKKLENFLVDITLRTGESFRKTLINPEKCKPVISDDAYIQWNFKNGSWIRENTTEKHLKETMLQKAGQLIKFRVDLMGLTPVAESDGIALYKSNGKIGLKIANPYYINSSGESTGNFDIVFEKINDHYEITYPTPTEDKLIDPTVEFSERGGAAIGGDHKDTSISAASANATWASSGDLRVHQIGVSYVALGRFSFIGSIPTNAIINTAVLSLTRLGTSQAGDSTLTIHRLNTLWGVDQTNEGATGSPPLGKEAVWNRAFYITAGTWAGGGAFSGVDYNAAEGAGNVVGAASAGVVVNWPIPIMVQNWVSNDATNAGWVMMGSAATRKDFDSQESASVAERPYLTVDYSVPSSGWGYNKYW